MSACPHKRVVPIPYHLPSPPGVSCTKELRTGQSALDAASPGMSDAAALSWMECGP